MAYYIFLKSLRSLEEFRKMLMSKFLLNLLLQISKALVNSKSNFYFENHFFPCFRPGQPCGPLGLWPRQPTGRATPAGRNLPGWPIQPACRSCLHGKYVFPFGSRLPEPTASPSSLCQLGPLVRCVFPTAPVDPGCFLPSPPAPHAGRPLTS
jgi:hypothetical protein